MKVLVTGAGGTLGGVVAARLLEAGNGVRGHDRADGDLADLAHVQQIVAGMDAVVHCAAIPSPVDHPDHEIFQNNVQTTYTVLATAGQAGIGRMVNISSASAIGLAWSRLALSPRSVPVTEEHPYVGEDVYGLSKQLGEITAAAVSRRWRATIISLRFPFIGTGDRLANHLRHIHEDPGVDRSGLWGWVDTRDAARAVEAALTADTSGHHVVHVAAPDTTALVPTAELLRRYHPTARIDRELGQFESVFSIARGQALLGFEPIYGWRGVVA